MMVSVERQRHRRSLHFVLEHTRRIKALMSTRDKSSTCVICYRLHKDLGPAVQMTVAVQRDLQYLRQRCYPSPNLSFPHTECCCVRRRCDRHRARTLWNCIALNIACAVLQIRQCLYHRASVYLHSLHAMNCFDV